MKHIKLFETTSVFGDIRDNLEKPWVALTQDDNKVYYSNEPFYGLTFTALVDNSTVKMRTYGPTIDKSLLYKLNDGNWVDWDMSIVELNAGDKMYIKSNDSNALGKNASNYTYFDMTGQISASGNIMSLLNYAETLPEYAFQYLFKSCRSLTTAPELPAETLADHCYYAMFFGCSALTQAPELPATTLVSSCYGAMFSGCSSLERAPELPATTLVNNCYYSMFAHCESLTTAPELPSTILATYCYSKMFDSCSSLTTAPELPATTLAEGCYSEMFSNCTALTTAPSILPAETLASSCYQKMFTGCSALNQAPELPATTLANYCYSYMFNGCSSLVNAPELPAETLVKSCYSYMFKLCKNLNYIKVGFTKQPTATNALSSWVSGVSSTGTFVQSVVSTFDVRGVSGIPDNWTIETY